MTRAKILALQSEIGQLYDLTEQLYALLSAGAGRVWQGSAYEACLREGADNREQAQQMLEECQKILAMITTVPDEPDSLPAEFLL